MGGEIGKRYRIWDRSNVDYGLEREVKNKGVYGKDWNYWRNWRSGNNRNIIKGWNLNEIYGRGIYKRRGNICNEKNGSGEDNELYDKRCDNMVISIKLRS